jgi:hypothetical protein
MTAGSITEQQRPREFARNMANDFDAVPLHNTVHDELTDVDQLARLCEAVNAAETATDCRQRAHGETGAGSDDLESAWGTLSHVARQRALEVVAASCITIVQDGDQWVADGYSDAETMADARQEARNRMRAHTTELERIGGIEEVPDQ